MSSSISVLKLAAGVLIVVLLMLCATCTVIHQQDTNRMVACVQNGGSWQPTGKVNEVGTEGFACNGGRK